MSPEHVPRPLSVSENGLEDVDLRQAVRSAIASGDRDAALSLLQAFAEGTTDLSTLPLQVGDALVATARGLQPEVPIPTVIGSLERVAIARDQIIQLLTETPFSGADLAAIRRVLDSAESAAREREKRAALEDLSTGQTLSGRRIGSVWLELKYIPDPRSDRKYGPYLYGRWREAGRKRSRYIGKARDS